MPKTVILAIGGAGCNMVESIMREASALWIREATYLFADTDQTRLAELAKKGYQTVLLKDSEIIDEKLNGVEKLYLLAGLGGNTGGAYINEVAKTAKTAGINDICAIVTTPFYFEGEGIILKAKEAIQSLDGIKNTVLHNDDLLEKYADINFATAFNYADIAAMKVVESGEI